MTDYIMYKAKCRAEKYRQSLKMVNSTKECKIFEIKPASENGYSMEKYVYKK